MSRRLFAACAVAAIAPLPAARAQIVIGEVLPAQWPRASVTRPLSEGAAAYVASINGAGGLRGQKMEIVTRDAGFQPQRTLDLVREPARYGRVVN